MKLQGSDSFWGGIVKSMGLVFGDIGTSPIYTLTVIFALTRPTVDNILGILSLIFWTITILVSAEYAWLAMALGRKGGGGTIVLKEILVRLLKPGRKIAFVGFLSFLGVSLLLGDGVITPAISILSAVEGMELIPGLGNLHQGHLILIAAIIAVVLFIFQFLGTDRVAGAFEIKAGYMEVIDIEKLLKKHEIFEKVIFYGVEDITTNNPVWRVFSTIKKQSPNFVQFNKLPASKLQGVVTRVEM